jgi:hypothetical protein
MAVNCYIRAFPKLSVDYGISTLSYMSAVSGLMADARTNIGTGWTRDNVQFIDSGSFITMFITYGTN